MPKSHTTITLDGLPWRVTLTWSTGRRPTVVAIEIKALRNADGERGEIGSALLRHLPIGQLSAMTRPQPEPVPTVDTPTTSRPRGLGVGHYQQVADVYRDAAQAGKLPAQVVAERFGVPGSTARRWISTARNRYHLLPELRSGQAG